MFRPAVAIFRFPKTIKMSLYNLCAGVLMKRSLCINPLFALVSSVNRLYISHEEVFSISSVEIGITVHAMKCLCRHKKERVVPPLSCHFIPGKGPVPIVKKLGGPRGRSGRQSKPCCHRESIPGLSSP
jgi:hypothetical protein